MGPWFPSEYRISNELKSLFSGMSEIDLSKRYTAEECLSHKWFMTSVSNKKLTTSVLKALTRFGAQCRFCLLMARMFAYQIDQAEREQLDRIFAECDINNDHGEVTWEEFRDCMKACNRAFTDDQLEMMFAMLDTDQNDHISKEEMLTAYSQQRLCAVVERLFAAFSKLDRDGDGWISRDEIKRVMNSLGPEMDPEMPNIARKILSVDHPQSIKALLKEEKEFDDTTTQNLAPPNKSHSVHEMMICHHFFIFLFFLFVQTQKI